MGKFIRKEWTEEEDQQLRNYVAALVPRKKICELLRRSKGSVGSRILNLGLQRRQYKKRLVSNSSSDSELQRLNLENAMYSNLDVLIEIDETGNSEELTPALKRRLYDLGFIRRRGSGGYKIAVRELFEEAKTWGVKIPNRS